MQDIIRLLNSGVESKGASTKPLGVNTSTRLLLQHFLYSYCGKTDFFRHDYGIGIYQTFLGSDPKLRDLLCTHNNPRKLFHFNKEIL